MKARLTILGAIAALLLGLLMPCLAFAQNPSDHAGKPADPKKKLAKAEVQADDKDVREGLERLHGYLDLTPRAASGFHNARFQEYRDLTPGITGGFGVNYENPSGLHFDVNTLNLGKEDVRVSAQLGDYGMFRVRAGYQQIPHNYAFGVLTLYNGAGTGNLTINPTVQGTLANTLLTTVPLLPTSSADAKTIATAFGQPTWTPDLGVVLLGPAGQRLTAAGSALSRSPFVLATAQMGTLLGTNGHLIDVANKRERTTFDVDVPMLAPFDVGGYMNLEHWTGSRPGSGYFGSDDDLGLIVELPSPTNFNVNNHGLHASYGKRPWYFGFNYDGSTFSNGTSNLLFANPMMTADAVAGPLGELRALSDVPLSGSAFGLLPLAPNNNYGNLQFTGSIMDLPLRGKLTLNGQFGWYRNTSNFAPYTSNSALLNPANRPSFGGAPGFLSSPGAFDGKADSSFFLARYAMTPWDWLHVNAHYRNYDYANHTPSYVLGKVAGDTEWEVNEDGVGVARQTYYTGFSKSSTGLDLGLDVCRGTTFNFTWESLTTNRTNRSVSHQNEGRYVLALNSNPTPWLNFRTSYERADRTGSYDMRTDTVLGKVFDEATGRFIFEDPQPNIYPYIRPFDLANRQHDRFRMDLAVSPADWLTLTGSFDASKNRYPDSPFGLQWQKDNGFAIGADLSPSKRFGMSFDYESRYYNTFQQNRHWKPSFDNWNAVLATGDPYTTEPGLGSVSNWTAEDRERSHYLSIAARYQLVPDFINLGARYTLSQNDGSVAYASPLGARGASIFKAYVNGNDNNFYLPFPLGNIDSNRLHTLNAHADIRLRKDMGLTLGWTWEKFYTDDINNQFQNIAFPVPSQATTNNHALLLGLFPRSYDANVYYATVKYKF